MKPIISVEGLGKSYTIRHEGQTRYKSLREELFKLPQRLLQRRCQNQEEFWALKDVSFDVMPGDRVGIIGRNGAGKSTLLKLLSRITEPTTGRITLRGRVASLLEVGTGFHPELTGRENIFLNGAILGMSRAEVRRKFDEIVDFAGVEKFLDTPVKRYSSGMYVRLAFAVAAHLEPEILIVDEVLAVGDAEFQKKCLGKMEEVGKEGRTVLFVSHNMGAIQQLCSRALMLQHGSLANDSTDIAKNISVYLGSDRNVSVWKRLDAQFDNVFFKPLEMEAIEQQDGSKIIKITGSIKKTNIGLQVGIAISSINGETLFWACHNDGPQTDWPQIQTGEYAFYVNIPKYFLNNGTYRVELLAAVYRQFWICQPGVSSPSIQLHIKGFISDSPYWNITRPGLLAPLFKWSVEEV
ncbi:ABC transporter ATP-binding protein [Desulfovibrio legallii]|uniref:ABC transporter ATP-binding protein n=1 Tax=Desulfovibrio legallii TaxID=571438 RepID=A0A6H3F3Y4_9BACT|nr:ABC transporter ATP-binding protein [Desulfovibrio legallii]TBH79077.1 ABC transporter ATP-binding protein [Desulfovibrio legallii]